MKTTRLRRTEIASEICQERTFRLVAVCFASFVAIGSAVFRTPFRGLRLPIGGATFAGLPR
jgi:hypothetical protein